MSLSIQSSRAIKNLSLLFIVSLMLSFVAGCNDDYGPVKRSWGEMKGLDGLVGNMNDTSYSQVKSMKPRLNALNKKVAIQEFEGQFVWAEYGSPLCDAATKQTLETKKVQSEINSQVTFLRILTAKSHDYYDHATATTAKNWSDRFQLNPERVLAADLWYKTVPEHRFFSPQGQTLFVHVGYLTSNQILDTIFYYKSGWEEWKETGKSAEWMNFQ